MSWLLILTIVIAFVLAFANGANDNAKGVATLIGSGTLSTRVALIYAAVMTFLGSAAAILLAGLLLKTFSGKGIVDEDLVGAAAFPVSVAIGAAATVLLATLIGIPISTTHSIVGAIIGIGLAAGGLHWPGVWSKFFYPLFASPFIALAAAYVLYVLFKWTRQRMGVTSSTCLCVGREDVPLTINTDGSFSVASTGMRIRRSELDQCRKRYSGRIVGLDAQRVLDWSHVATAGSVSFARGLNDTPKIAAVMLAAGAAGAKVSLLAVGVGIALGGLLAVRRVARTMSYRITGMNDGQGFTANLVTAILVIVASRFGVPVSTTHVSCGSLFGIGAANRRGHWKMISTIVAAWITTLPVAAALGFAAWHVLS